MLMLNFANAPALIVLRVGSTCNVVVTLVVWLVSVDVVSEVVWEVCVSDDVTVADEVPVPVTVIEVSDVKNWRMPIRVIWNRPT